MQRFFAYPKQLQLLEDEFASIRSDPLMISGVILPTNDFQVIYWTFAWQQVRKIASSQINDDYGAEIVALFNGRVTFGNNRGSGDSDVDERIGETEFTDRPPFVNSECIVEHTMPGASEKDLRHIELLSRSKSSAHARNDDQRLIGVRSPMRFRCRPDGHQLE